MNRLLTAPERVQIANDVLAQLDKKAFRARGGAYVCTDDGVTADEVDRWSANVDVREKALDITKRSRKCEVCAKGSLVIASFIRYDGILSEYANYGDCWHLNTSDICVRLFGMQQACRIEAYFESFWLTRYKNPTLRLRRIMENIIENKGVFSPVGGWQLE